MTRRHAESLISPLALLHLPLVEPRLVDRDTYTQAQIILGDHAWSARTHMNGLTRDVDHALATPTVHDRKTYADGSTILGGAHLIADAVVGSSHIETCTVAGTTEEIAGDKLGDILKAYRGTVHVGTLEPKERGGAILLHAVVGSEGQALVISI